MADPVLTKLLAQTAVRLAADEKIRNRMLIIILAPVFFILLLIALIVYLISSPFTALSQWLVGGEIMAVDNLQKGYGYNQGIGIYDNDYVTGANSSYEGMVFSDCIAEVTYYSQMDVRWRDKDYGTDKIGTHGCGPTSMAIVISSLTGEAITPVDMAEWSVQNGHWCQENGSYHRLIPEAAKSFGLSVFGITETEGEKLIDALSSGKLVVAIMGEGHFTKSGHFIVLRGITTEGKILVADPASYERSEQEWELDVILKEARKGAGAGGPFWAIGR